MVKKLRINSYGSQALSMGLFGPIAFYELRTMQWFGSKKACDLY